MSLSLVIPVHNDAKGLLRLLEQAQGLGWVTEILVVDDASDPPCGPEMDGLPEAVAQDPRLVWLRSATHRGAGHARNLGLARARGTHLLFFDSDDLFLPAMTDLMEDLAGPMARQDFDFCLFGHLDSRARGDTDPMAAEARFWPAEATETPAPLDLQKAPQLVRIAAYPWNKIYRTAFLRDHAIGCTEIMVHNDIELHWLSFLRARRILVSTRVGCEHVVHPTGGRLTNRRGAERLAVFTALSAVQQALGTARQGRAFQAGFTDFTLRLFDWITGTLEPGLRADFTRKARTHLRRHLTRAVFTGIALDDPDLAGRLLAWPEEEA